MEDINEITVSIKNHHDLEVEYHVANIAIGRSLVSLQKKENVYWLTNREDRGSHQHIVNIHGEVIGTTPGREDTLTDDGSAVYKNTKLGEILIKSFEGTHKYKVPKGTITLAICNRTSYSKNLNSEIINLKINIAGEGLTYQYRNINEILKVAKTLQKEIDEKERETEGLKSDKERKEHLDALKKKKKELEEIKIKAQNFIRQQVELRNQHILDPQQEDIKRADIFDKTLIINGGPGTGKTTALIQRIMFLKASSILEYKPDLSQDQKEVLFTNDSWIFFSPSELLRLYLKNNMTQEGLTASDNKVMVWKTYKNELCRRYKIFNSETRRPFLDLNKEVDFFDLGASNIKNLSDAFDLYFFNLQKNKIKRIIDIKIDGFGWKYIALGIKENLTKVDKLDNWKAWVRLYLQLNNQFNDRVNNVVNEYKDLSDKIANEVLLKIKSDSILLKKIYDFLEKLLENSRKNSSIDEDNEDETIDFDESEIINPEKDIELFKKLKAICRKYALLKYDSSVKLTKDEQELAKLITDIKTRKEYDKLGELAYFIKYFKRIVNGSVVNIFAEIAKTYKLFRKDRIDNYLTSKGKETLLGILKDNNIRIHHDEQSFLLYKINQINRTLFSSDRNTYLNSNNSFISAFRDCTKPIIAIDEATDFSVLDIIAMHSLSHPLVSSVTLSGDLMQRMTRHGIREWTELSEIIQDIDLRNLDISYRQSYTLLEVAKTIYTREFGKETNYRAFAKKDENEPKPLSFFSGNKIEKLSWIAERIIEIYNAYGRSIPSIAIFLSQDFEEFTYELNGLDVLSDVGIKTVLCRDGQILGDKNAVRVFPLEFIKGLEFEAVFFHDIDSLEVNELLLRYFYVGLSRATFYLAITGRSGVPESISKIKHLFRTGDWKI